MYANPVLLPEITNREDFLRTFSGFDDDTGQPFDFSGRTLAAPGDFTGAVWTVTSGTVISASVTPLTIKDYPFGLEMQAITCVIGVGLAILAGAPVTISDATGKNTMTGYVTSYAPATGVLVAQIGCAFDFEMRAHHHHNGSGYGTWWGDDCSGTPEIRAQLGSGILVVGLGVIQVRIPAVTMQTLRHRTYDVGMILFDGSDTRQIFLGKQPILYGGVSTMPFASTSPANPFGLP